MRRRRPNFEARFANAKVCNWLIGGLGLLSPQFQRFAAPGLRDRAA
jgi:hypothetical protein